MQCLQQPWYSVIPTLGKYERAIEDYDKAIELDPEDAAIAYNNQW